MDSYIKQYADKGDISSLKYIFVDCLDVDPTFEEYREEYDYCKRVSGLFEDYKQLTPLSENKNDWDIDYWANLKNDLIKNFSDKRFQYMIKVAQVVHKEKIERLKRERKQLKSEKEKSLLQEQMYSKQIENLNNHQFTEQTDLKKQQDEELEKKRKQLALEYENQIKREKAEKQQQIIRTQSLQQSHSKSSNDSKKAMGIVLLSIILIVILVILIIVLI